MLSIFDPRRSRLCDGVSRREILRAGSLAFAGSGLASSHAASNTPPVNPKAKRCILLFLMGGPTQHSTWDPKPEAVEEVRGAYSAISTSVPGTQISELMPRTAQLMEHLAVLRAVTTGDHAHSSSGYAMLTGQPHAPMNRENANPGAPNDWPTLGAVVQRLKQNQSGALPGAIRLPMHIFNTDRSVWPGQDAGFLGPAADPWLFRCEPNSTEFRAPELGVSDAFPRPRLNSRRNLLQQLDQQLRQLDNNATLDAFATQNRQALDLLGSSKAAAAFDLQQETDAARDHYGRHQFGQSVLLGRRLLQAGVSMVQVNWFRGPNEPTDAPCWDSHTNETARLKNVLVPPFDQTLSALLRDLKQLDMLDDTLVLCMGEFGRSPKFNARGGRDHWGHVFSVAMAGGGIQGGVVHGQSDNHAAYPVNGIVRPADLTATIYQCLGYSPDTQIYDQLKRPHPISRGRVIHEVLS